MEPQPLSAAERVAQLIKTLDISSYQFGKETGLSHQTISNVLTGKNRPSLDTLEAIAARYPDTAIWLLTGTGEPRTGRALASVGHDRAAAHPTVQPADKELTSGTATGPTMFVNTAGTLEGHWKMIAEERAARLSDKDQEIERLMQQLEAWQEAFRKPLASAEAATHLTHSVSSPIGPRFDSAPANMWVERQAA